MAGNNRARPSHASLTASQCGGRTVGKGLALVSGVDPNGPDVALRTNLRLADLPGNVLIRRRKSGLPKDSVANVSQIATVDRGWLSERVGSVTRRQIEAVEEGLRLLLAV